MTPHRPHIWRSSFHPDASPADMAAMRQAYLATRRDHGERMLALCAEVAPQVTRKAFDGGVLPLMETLPEKTDELFADPVFFTWAHFLNRAVVRQSGEEIQFHCNKLDEVIGRVKTRLAGEEAYYVSDTPIALQQDNIDPYVMAATPPSYDFETVLRSEKGMNGHGHPLPMQRDLIGFAMNNIERAWPDLKAQIVDVVKIIGYLPDATFRSCSAARYAGVTYLGNKDEGVLDIEESIVHEAGHQVLYRLAEVIPLVKDGTPQTSDYTLPWSGSKRDLFGFLHAFYIYVLLTKYFWRRAQAEVQNSRECVRRAVLIQIGSRLAVPMLLKDANLSDQGRVLVEELAADMIALEAEIEAKYGKAGAGHG